MSTIRVLLVDDHPIVRMGIRHFLNKDPQIEVVGEAGSGAEALRLALKLQPDLLLLDLGLPDMSGSQVAQRLKAQGSPAYILILSEHSDRTYIQGLLSTGVSGYLLKDEVPEAILKAVHGVARGEQGWISRKVAAILSTPALQEPDRAMGITSRQKQVLDSLAAGKSNKDIALALNMSEKTVEKHVRTILKKLGVSSRVEAAVYWTRLRRREREN